MRHLLFLALSLVFCCSAVMAEAERTEATDCHIKTDSRVPAKTTQVMESSIKRAWFPPKGYEDKTIVIRFKLDAHGETLEPQVIKSSGNSLADESAIEAVANAGPFEATQLVTSEIQFTFNNSLFEAGSRNIYRWW